MIETAGTLLKTIFGYDRFLPLQEDIINNVLTKKDALVVMPTGGGKSICYQIPALIFDGLTVVVSPLISLMKDQIDQLLELDVPAVLLNSQLPPDAYRQNIYQIKRKKAKLLYLAPETFLKKSILDLLSSVQVDCLAVDEAHCISKWGHDFRPEYRQLAETRPIFKDAVCIALTATATLQVRKDIQKSLAFDAANEFVASFNRPNLFIKVVEKSNPLEQTLGFIEKNTGESGIIYCATRKTTERLYESLIKERISAKPYHAGLPDRERTKNQELFINDDIQVMVATIAFGMGINKPNVRFILHYDLPQNLENYYQEIGRAGRDGLPARCLLLFGYGDIPKIRYIIQNKAGHEQRLANIHLNSLLQFIETESCRRVPLLKYFGEDHPADCRMCDNCLSEEKEQIDVTIPAQKFLSCVKRTGERFGANYIIDVLRGSKSQKVIKFGHHKLSTYGIGEDYSRKQWLHMSRQLLIKGLMVQDMDYGGLRLTEAAYSVFKGTQVFVSRILPETPPKTSVAVDVSEYDRELFETLRRKRKELADIANFPPYVIFPDKSLMEMAILFPKNESELLRIHGVGDAKLKKYGKIFLEIIEAYCVEKNILYPEPGQKTRRHVAVGDAYNSGQTIEQIMMDYDIKLITVLGHLYSYLLEGRSIRIDELLAYPGIAPETRQKVYNSFEILGWERLKPIFEALDQKVGYETLKIIQICFISERAVLPTDVPGSMFNKQIVCLANSRKYNGHCIAGKELTPEGLGKWIRPVSEQDTGELTKEDMRLRNNEYPKVLDILEINLKRKHCPYCYQSENYLIDKTPWVLKRKFPIGEISKLCDPVDCIWINGYHSRNGFNDRIPVKTVEEQITSSLLFIKPDHFSIVVEEDARALKKVRAKFDFNGIQYKLAVTDPLVENSYIDKRLGEYQPAGENIYLTVSLGEPYEGYCYKLVAGIIHHF